MILDKDVSMQDASVRCLEILSLARKDYWRAIKEHSEYISFILYAEQAESAVRVMLCYRWYNLLLCAFTDGIPALVKLLKSERHDIQSVAASVLCNISEEGMLTRAIELVLCIL